MTPLLSCGPPDADILFGNVLGLSCRFAPMQFGAFCPNPISKFIILNIQEKLWRPSNSGKEFLNHRPICTCRALSLNSASSANLFLDSLYNTYIPIERITDTLRYAIKKYKIFLLKHILPCTSNKSLTYWYC